jgi:C-terminal processing protease CtpA/Prc
MNSPAASQSQLNSEDRSRGHLMLNMIKTDLEKNYYDPKFHGIDLDALFKNADGMIKRATSVGQVFGIIAQAVNALDDSHVYFIPPQQTVQSDYGYQLKMIGDRCYVIAVKPGSNAESVGLKVGDRLQQIGVVVPTRENFEKLHYLFYVLRPQPGMRLRIQSPDGSQRSLDVLAKVRQEKRTLNFAGWDDGHDIHNYIREVEAETRIYRNRYSEVGEDLFIWKMPQFYFGDNELDAIMDKARKHKALILDLRGNGGGTVDSLEQLLGYFFDHDVKIAELKGRKEEKPLIAKHHGKNIFNGKLCVLIDSQSASASELFAREIQLEKRGTVVGDASAGAVMRAKAFFHEIGMDIKVIYGDVITVSDLIMSDGKSLEKVGVTPDYLLLPTGADLAAGRDPIMSHAAESVGVTLSPEKAGSLFPIEWRK